MEIIRVPSSQKRKAYSSGPCAASKCYTWFFTLMRKSNGMGWLIVYWWTKRIENWDGPELASNVSERTVLQATREQRERVDCDILLEDNNILQIRNNGVICFLKSIMWYTKTKKVQKIVLK